MVLQNYGLSLSDQYWFKPVDRDLKWEEINYFDHDFSEDIGEKLLGHSFYSRDISLRSPDNTSDGWLRKAWKIIDDKRVLLKGGSDPYQQEPFNEVLAAKIAEALNFSYTDYWLITTNENQYSACANFIDRNTEFVPAWQLISKYNRPNPISPYEWYLEICKKYEIPDIQRHVNDMLVLDYLIGNTDRHYNNFGLIRDARSLEMTGIAPIFDSGTSMGYSTLTQRLSPNQEISAKPFKRTQEKQIELVDLQPYDFSALNHIKEVAEHIYSSSLIFQNLLDGRERIQNLAHFLVEREKMLMHHQSLQQKKHLYVSQTFEDDHDLSVPHEEGNQETDYDSLDHEDGLEL